MTPSASMAGAVDNCGGCSTGGDGSMSDVTTEDFDCFLVVSHVKSIRNSIRS